MDNNNLGFQSFYIYTVCLWVYSTADGILILLTKYLQIINSILDCLMSKIHVPASPQKLSTNVQIIFDISIALAPFNNFTLCISWVKFKMCVFLASPWRLATSTFLVNFKKMTICPSNWLLFTKQYIPSLFGTYPEYHDRVYF